MYISRSHSKPTHHAYPYSFTDNPSSDHTVHISATLPECYTNLLG